MDLVTILLIAVGLSMDAFAVSITHGITIRHERMNNAFRVGFFFGGFQSLMPVIGWLAGRSLRDFIAGVDHWIAFGLLGFIGGKMIYESLKLDPGKKDNTSLELSTLLLLAIATSIDALAVGVSFAFLKISIITPAVVIGAVTFLLSFLGFLVGNRVGHFFESKIEIVGGIILIGIGIKILIQDLLKG